MSDDQNVTDTHNSSHKNGSTEVLRNSILELRAQGYRTKEIATKLQCTRETVSRHLNSKEAKKVIEAGRERLVSLVDWAVDVYETCMTKDEGDLTNARSAAKDILQNFGLLRTQVDLNHNFPKPTVIRRHDGSEVVLGTTEDIVNKVNGE